MARPDSDHDLVERINADADPRTYQSAGSFDARIASHLQRHLDAEQRALDDYEALANDSGNPSVRYLASLLLEDERRHHRVMTEMLNQFRTSLYLVERRPHVPWMLRQRDSQTASAVRRLRRIERRDLWDLRRLRHRLGFLRRDSLNGVLVNALILDTRKHLHYLRTMRRLV